MKSSLRRNQPSWLRQRDNRLYTDYPARAVYLASPDGADIAPVSLPFTAGQDEAGRYIEFTQPALAYWNMIFLR